MNDGAATAVPSQTSLSNGLFNISLPAGTSKFVLNLPAKIVTETRLHNAIAIHRGSLNFALDSTCDVPHLPLLRHPVFNILMPHSFIYQENPQKEYCTTSRSRLRIRRYRPLGVCHRPFHGRVHPSIQHHHHHSFAHLRLR
jgi:hypothetical protein